MAFNLLGAVTDRLDDDLIGQLSNLSGLNSNQTGSALKSMLPTLIGGMINKGSSTQGASALLDLITKGGHTGGLLDNLSHVLSSDKSKGLMDTGNGLLSSIFGGNLSSIFNILGKVTGLSRGSSGSLMSLLAPIVVNFVGKRVKNKALDAVGLSKMLGNQKEYVKNGIPEEARGMLGFGADQKRTAAATATASAANLNEAPKSGGGGFMKLLLPLLLLLGGLWWFMNRDADTATTDNSATTTTVESGAATTANSAGTHTHADGTVHTADHKTVEGAANSVKDAAGNAADAVKGAADDAMDAAKNAVSYTVNAAGDLVDNNGKLIAKKGEFKVDTDGSFLDKDGNRFGAMMKKVGGAIGDAANATGNAAKKVGGAVAGAAGKTVDAMSGMFGKMFSKESGAKTSYNLNDISWDDGYKITNFSKEEIQGLAAALKVNKDAKIQVQVASGDKKVAGMRAKVIQDMLVTLGVAGNQISSKGMEGGDSAAVVVQ